MPPFTSLPTEILLQIALHTSLSSPADLKPLLLSSRRTFSLYTTEYPRLINDSVRARLGEFLPAALAVVRLSRAEKEISRQTLEAEAERLRKEEEDPVTDGDSDRLDEDAPEVQQNPIESPGRYGTDGIEGYCLTALSPDKRTPDLSDLLQADKVHQKVQEILPALWHQLYRYGLWDLYISPQSFFGEYSAACLSAMERHPTAVNLSRVPPGMLAREFYHMLLYYTADRIFAYHSLLPRSIEDGVRAASFGEHVRDADALNDKNCQLAGLVLVLIGDDLANGDRDVVGRDMFSLGSYVLRDSFTLDDWLAYVRLEGIRERMELFRAVRARNREFARS